MPLVDRRFQIRQRAASPTRRRERHVWRRTGRGLQYKSGADRRAGSRNASAVLVCVSAGANLYPAAIHTDGTLIGDPAVQPGARKATPGESITLYVNGLAPSQAGVRIAAPVPYTDPVTVTVGAATATVTFAGLAGPGQFPLNIQLPPDLQAGGQTSPGRVLLPIQ